MESVTLFLIVVLLLIIVKRTKSLMLPLGYNTKVLINSEIKESLWTGHSIIPESGLIVAIICILMFIYFQIRAKDYRN